jgi:hypothetical protein
LLLLLDVQVDSPVYTKDVGVQCSLHSTYSSTVYVDASVQCDVPPPLATSTPPHYLAESSESELSQMDIEDAPTDPSFHLSQESTM